MVTKVKYPNIPKIPQELPKEIREWADKMRTAVTLLVDERQEEIDGGTVKFGTIREKALEKDLLQDVKATRFYIEPLNGTAIRNSTGTLSIRVIRVDGSGFTPVTSGPIKMFKPDGSLAGNGYVWSGITAADISSSIMIELRSTPGSPGVGVWDTITLVDVTDGIVGSVNASNGLVWVQAQGGGAWSPVGTTTDLVVTYYRGGVAVATETVRVTLNTTNGTLTAATTVDHADITNSVLGSGTSALTVTFTHTPSSTVVGEQVLAARSDAVRYYIKPTTGTAIKNNNGTVTIEAHILQNGVDTLLSAGTVELFDPANNPLGFSETLDSVQISESIVITLKDGAGGPALDTITLVDITDTAAAGASILDYDDLDTTQQAAGAGRYALLNNIASNTSGIQNNFQTAVGLLIHEQETDLDNQKNLYLGIQIGDHVVYWISDLRWYEYEVTSIDPAPVAPANRFKWGLTFLRSVDADPTVNVPLTAGFNVEFRFSKVGIPVVGSINASNGIAWVQAQGGGAWTPAGTTTDLTATFFRGGAQIATRVVRVTLTTSNGTLTAALQSSTGEPTSDAVTGSGTSALTVEFTHTDSTVKVSEQVVAVRSDAVRYYIKPLNGTAIQNNTGTLTIEAHILQNGVDTLLSAGTVELFDPANNPLGFTETLNAAQINGSIIITLKDGAAGAALDTITLVDVTDTGSVGSTVLDYDDLDTTGLAAGLGRYALLTNIASNTSGTQNNFQTVVGLLIHKQETDTVDQTNFYLSIAIGDHVVYHISDVRWYEYEVTSIDPAPVAPADRFKWGLSFVRSVDADPTVTVQTTPGFNVEFRWSKVTIPVIGSVAASNGLAWSRDPNKGVWTPSGTTTDLTATFYRGGVSIATRTVRVTLNTTDGTLTGALQANTGEATAHIITGSGTAALAVQFSHNDSAIDVFEQVITVRGGEESVFISDPTFDISTTFGDHWGQNGTGQAFVVAGGVAGSNSMQLVSVSTGLKCRVFTSNRFRWNFATTRARIRFKSSGTLLDRFAVTMRGYDAETGGTLIDTREIILPSIPNTAGAFQTIHVPTNLVDPGVIWGEFELGWARIIPSPTATRTMEIDSVFLEVVDRATSQSLIDDPNFDLAIDDTYWEGIGATGVLMVEAGGPGGSNMLRFTAQDDADDIVEISSRQFFPLTKDQKVGCRIMGQFSSAWVAANAKVRVAIEGYDASGALVETVNGDAMDDSTLSTWISQILFAGPMTLDTVEQGKVKLFVGTEGGVPAGNFELNQYEPFYTAVDVQNSLVTTFGKLELVGDVSAPGNNQVYGTTGAGVKGWKADPLPAVKRSIEFDVGALQLVGDVASPGNDQVYGTNSGGTRVWKAGADQSDGSFTATLTGMTAATTGTVFWSKTGNKVTLWITANILGTSNSAVMNMTGLPTDIQMTVIKNILHVCGGIRDGAAGGTGVYGSARFTAAATINFGIQNPNAGAGLFIQNKGFQASGTKGLTTNWGFTYDIT